VTCIEENKDRDFASNRSNFMSCESNTIEMDPYKVEEIVNPTLSNNLENLLKNKSIVLGQKCALEHVIEESDTTMSDATSLCDEIDFFYSQVNPTLDIEFSIENTDKTIS